MRGGELGLEDNSQGQALSVHSWYRDTMKACSCPCCDWVCVLELLWREPTSTEQRLLMRPVSHHPSGNKDSVNLRMVSRFQVYVLTAREVEN